MSLLSPQDHEVAIEALEFWIERLIHDYAEDEALTEKIRQADSLLQWIKLQRDKFTV